MGTLTSFSFCAVNFKFHSDSVFRKRVAVLGPNRFTTDSCYLCGRVAFKEFWSRKCFRVRCFNGDNGGDYGKDDGEMKDVSSSKESSVTTASRPEEGEERSSKEPSTSVSSTFRVVNEKSQLTKLWFRAAIDGPSVMDFTTVTPLNLQS